MSVGKNVNLGQGLVYTITKKSRGPGVPMIAKFGDSLKVKYQGALAKTGKVFDKGVIEFKLGKGEVIQGWDKGLSGIALGEGRKILIPSRLGYGARGAGPKIPANADLVFDTEVLAIRGIKADSVGKPVNKAERRFRK